MSNKFQALAFEEVDAKNIEGIYNSLIRYTEEIALAVVPDKKGRGQGQSKPSNYSTGAEASSHPKSVSLAYHQYPTQTNKMQPVISKKK